MSGGTDIFFVDTNVLLYTLDNVNLEKRARAETWLLALWRSGAGRLSWQVLHEFYWNAERKLHAEPGLTRRMVQRFADWQPIAAHMALIGRAWHWCDQAQLAYWDALIVAAAEHAGAGYIISEDFEHGRRFGACRVLNPFRADPAEYFPAAPNPG